VRFGAHLKRLEESVALQGCPAAIDPAAARRLVGAALRAGGHPESRLRLTFAPPRLFASVEAFVPPPRSRYEEGVGCVTLPFHRDQPRVKDTDFVRVARRAYAELPPGIEEGLLLGEDGSILEGLSSNFFAVLDGALYTEDRRVLAGITRALVLEVAEARMRVVRRAVRRDEGPRIGEAFITSASREVLPVARDFETVVRDETEEV
jgi:branched-chain amino acid aminotransferase